MSAGALLLSSSGKRLLNSDGDRVLSNGGTNDCCDCGGPGALCWQWPVWDRAPGASETNPVNGRSVGFYLGVLLAGGRDWSSPFGAGRSQNRTGCRAYIAFTDRELTGTDNDDMAFAGSADPDYVLRHWTRYGGPVWAPGDGTQTYLTTKPYFYPCLNWGGYPDSAWVTPTLSQVRDLLMGDLGLQGRAPWFDLDAGGLSIGTHYDILVNVDFWKRATSRDTSGPTPVLVYQDEADGYAIMTIVGVEVT